MSDLYIESKKTRDRPTKPSTSPKAKEVSRSLTKSWYYKDADGNLLFTKQRFDILREDGTRTKEFSFKHINSEGALIHSKPCHSLYNLDSRPGILKQNPEAPTIIVEGEKCVDALQELLGTRAWVTTAGSASDWRTEFCAMVNGTPSIILVPDMDEPGQLAMESIHSSLRINKVKAKITRIEDIPGVPEKGDIYDWIQAGGTTEEFFTLVDAAENNKPFDFGSLPDVYAFPLEVLPEELSALVRAGSSAQTCPPDFIAVPMIAVLGAAIGTSCVVEIKPHWRERPCLYVAVVGEPGSIKSPALSLAVKPIYSIQHEYSQEHDEATQKYDLDMEEYEEAIKSYKQFGRERPRKPIRPKMKHAFSTNATIESMFDMLHSNPRGILMKNDELSSWVLGMNQYRAGKGDDQQKYMSFWSGDQEKIDRKTQDPIYIENPFVCITGNIPPDVLPKLTNEQGHEDGFIHRILFSYPDVVRIRWTSSEIDPYLLANYDSLVRALYAIPWRNVDGNPYSPNVIRLSADAEKLFKDWFNDHEEEKEQPLFPICLRGPWGKFRGYCARLTLILHLARTGGELDPDGISRDDMLNGIILTEYFKKHCRRVYAKLQITDKDMQVQRVAEWARTRTNGILTPRDLAAAHIVTKTSDAIEVFQTLQKYGLGSIEPGKRKNTLQFRVTF